MSLPHEFKAKDEHMDVDGSEQDSPSRKNYQYFHENSLQHSLHPKKSVLSLETNKLQQSIRSYNDIAARKNQPYMRPNQRIGANIGKEHVNDVLVENIHDGLQSASMVHYNSSELEILHKLDKLKIATHAMKKLIDNGLLASEQRSRDFKKELVTKINSALIELENRLLDVTDQKIKVGLVNSMEFRRKVKADVLTIRSELDAYNRRNLTAMHEMEKHISINSTLYEELKTKLEILFPHDSAVQFAVARDVDLLRDELTQRQAALQSSIQNTDRSLSMQFNELKVLANSALRNSERLARQAKDQQLDQLQSRLTMFTHDIDELRRLASENYGSIHSDHVQSILEDAQSSIKSSMHTLEARVGQLDNRHELVTTAHNEQLKLLNRKFDGVSSEMEKLSVKLQQFIEKDAQYRHEQYVNEQERESLLHNLVNTQIEGVRKKLIEQITSLEHVHNESFRKQHENDKLLRAEWQSHDVNLMQHIDKLEKRIEALEKRNIELKRNDEAYRVEMDLKMQERLSIDNRFSQLLDEREAVEAKISERLQTIEAAFANHQRNHRSEIESVAHLQHQADVKQQEKLSHRIDQLESELHQSLATHFDESKRVRNEDIIDLENRLNSQKASIQTISTDISNMRYDVALRNELSSTKILLTDLAGDVVHLKDHVTDIESSVLNLKTNVNEQLDEHAQDISLCRSSQQRVEELNSIQHTAIAHIESEFARTEVVREQIMRVNLELERNIDAVKIEADEKQLRATTELNNKLAAYQQHLDTVIAQRKADEARFTVIEQRSHETTANIESMVKPLINTLDSVQQNLHGVQDNCRLMSDEISSHSTQLSGILRLQNDQQKQIIESSDLIAANKRDMIDETINISTKLGHLESQVHRNSSKMQEVHEAITSSVNKRFDSQEADIVKLAVALEKIESMLQKTATAQEVINIHNGVHELQDILARLRQDSVGRTDLSLACQKIENRLSSSDVLHRERVEDLVAQLRIIQETYAQVDSVERLRAYVDDLFDQALPKFRLHNEQKFEDLESQRASRLLEDMNSQNDSQLAFDDSILHLDDRTHQIKIDSHKQMCDQNEQQTKEFVEDNVAFDAKQHSLEHSRCQHDGMVHLQNDQHDQELISSESLRSDSTGCSQILDITLSAMSLPLKQHKSGKKCNPLVALYVRHSGSVKFEFAKKSEWCKDSTSPSWKKHFYVAGNDEQDRSLLFRVYDVSSTEVSERDRVGDALINFRDAYIAASQGKQLSVLLKHGNTDENVLLQKLQSSLVFTIDIRPSNYTKPDVSYEIAGEAALPSHELLVNTPTNLTATPLSGSQSPTHSNTSLIAAKSTSDLASVMAPAANTIDSELQEQPKSSVIDLTVADKIQPLDQIASPTESSFPESHMKKVLLDSRSSATQKLSEANIIDADSSITVNTGDELLDSDEEASWPDLLRLSVKCRNLPDIEGSIVVASWIHEKGSDEFILTSQTEVIVAKSNLDFEQLLTLPSKHIEIPNGSVKFSVYHVSDTMVSEKDCIGSIVFQIEDILNVSALVCEVSEPLTYEIMQDDSDQTVHLGDAHMVIQCENHVDDDENFDDALAIASTSIKFIDKDGHIVNSISSNLLPVSAYPSITTNDSVTANKQELQMVDIAVSVRNCPSDNERPCNLVVAAFCCDEKGGFHFESQTELLMGSGADVDWEQMILLPYISERQQVIKFNLYDVAKSEISEDDRIGSVLLRLHDLVAEPKELIYEIQHENEEQLNKLFQHQSLMILKYEPLDSAHTSNLNEAPATSMKAELATSATEHDDFSLDLDSSIDEQ